MNAKTTIKLTAILAVACIGVFGIMAQSAKEPTKTETPTVTTNWAGYLVVGRDSIDMVGYGPDTGVATQIQIGLRSDGIVVWRDTPKTK